MDASSLNTRPRHKSRCVAAGTPETRSTSSFTLGVLACVRARGRRRQSSVARERKTKEKTRAFGVDAHVATGASSSSDSMNQHLAHLLKIASSVASRLSHRLGHAHVVFAARVHANLHAHARRVARAERVEGGHGGDDARAPSSAERHVK